MTRNNFSNTRYKVYALLSCEHELQGVYLLPFAEGMKVFCDKCEDTVLVEAVESELYGVRYG